MFSSKKHILTWAGAGVLLAVLGYAHPEFALIEHAKAATPNPPNLQDNLRGALLIQVVLLRVIYMILHFTGLLLNPKFVYEVTQLGTGNPLHSLWVLSRDIMNTLFAFMLVLAALFTIVKADSTLIKEKLGKFVIAVILVNFSWYFPRVILDVSTVLAASIYNLPNAVGVSCTTAGGGGGCKAIQNMWFDPADFPAGCSSGSTNFIQPSPGLCVELVPLTTTNTSIGVLNGLFLNHMNLINLHKVNAAPGSTAGSTTLNIPGTVQFAMGVFTSILFTVAVAFPLIAIFFAMLIRLPVLWVTIMLMPFMFIGFVGGDILGKLNTNKIFEEFLKAAFMPVVAGAPLALGYIIIGATGAASNPCPTGGLVALSGFCEAQRGLTSGVQNLWDLLWNFLGIAVIWMGVFLAIKSMGGFYADIAGKVQGIGESWGKFALKAPLAVNGLPGNAGMVEGVRNIINNPDALINSGGKFKSISELAGTINNRNSGGGSTGNANVDKVVNDVRNNATVKNTFNEFISSKLEPQETARLLAEQLRQSARTNGIVLNPEELKQAARSAATQAGVTNQAKLEEMIKALPST